ncbi:dethiobiotin synthase [Bowmanella dokdonensis]|uniref:ATP-dependent dethiobiotin synthetase BioD n=1 Tax=Bowmanella dokdonensis TaxID=751969 RepID=A0A939DSQ5_9ALTE|nr:dethiobiotin synthase [Bowmanella dokdonensis]MBN7827216.1 dethiobiotin synthase [Bowmanella dokdonensis]
MKRIFVTGTDTEVGKTFASVAILNQLNNRRLRTAACKPVASGCVDTEEGLRNEDALALQQAASVSLPYAQVNPIAFAAPVAPHIAASQQGMTIDESRLSDNLRHFAEYSPDLLLVEGAGGWRLPLGGGRFLSDWVKEQKLSVVLVVGMRLGCLNHALLTAEAISRDGLELVGWIANQVETDMPYVADNLALLKAELNGPFLGHIPRLANAGLAHQYLDLTPLL